MSEQGTPTTQPSTKTVKKWGKTIRINFIGALETNERFIVTRQMLNHENGGGVQNLCRRAL